MILVSDPQKIVGKGDFGAEVCDCHNQKALLIPRVLFDILAQYNIRSAEKFITYVHTFPTHFSVTFLWDYEDVEKALEKLKRQLKGHIHEDFINPPSQPKRGYGARPPSGVEDKKNKN